MALFFRDTLLGRDTLLHSNTAEDTSRSRVLEISSAYVRRSLSQRITRLTGYDRAHRDADSINRQGKQATPKGFTPLAELSNDQRQGRRTPSQIIRKRLIS
jgi:hypothetical protein